MWDCSLGLGDPVGGLLVNVEMSQNTNALVPGVSFTRQRQRNDEDRKKP